MAKKTVGHVKLVWTCPRCATRNPGPNKFCNGCGGPQPEDVQFEQPPEAELIKDSAEIARAKAGPDIHCPFCSSRNPGGVKFCGACGGDLAEGQARTAGRVVGAHRAPSGATRACPACGTANPLTALNCSNCGSALPTEPAAPSSAPKPATPSRVRRGPGIIFGGVAAAVCLIAAAAFLFLGQRRNEFQAEVERVRWERSIAIEALSPVEATSWRDDLPSEASDASCRLEYRETQDNPAPIATEVCGTPYTIDEGSGYGEVVQDCVYQVYDEFCTYTVLDWSVVETLTQDGEDPNPVWPRRALGSDEREGDRSETFTVTLVGADDTLTYSPDSEEAFSAFVPGSSWTVVVNGLGGIVRLEPAP